LEHVVRWRWGERTNPGTVAQAGVREYVCVVCVCGTAQVLVCVCVYGWLTIIHTDRLDRLAVAVFVRVDMLLPRPWQEREEREETSEPCFMQTLVGVKR